MAFSSEGDKLIIEHMVREATWQQMVLALYNPSTETRALKAAKLLTETFLSSRQAHRERHDFSVYRPQPQNNLYQSALGC
jgi:hypothetical protein